MCLDDLKNDEEEKAPYDLKFTWDTILPQCSKKHKDNHRTEDVRFGETLLWLSTVKQLNPTLGTSSNFEKASHPNDDNSLDKVSNKDDCEDIFSRYILFIH